MHPRFMRPSTADDARDLARLTADGLLRRVVGDVHVSLLEPDDRELRAAAAAVLLPPRLLAAGGRGLRAGRRLAARGRRPARTGCTSRCRCAAAAPAPTSSSSTRPGCPPGTSRRSAASA